MRVARRMTTQLTLERMFGTTKKQKTADNAEVDAAAPLVATAVEPIRVAVPVAAGPTAASPTAPAQQPSQPAQPAQPNGESKLFGFLLDPSWRDALAPEFRKPYIVKLEKTLAAEKGPVFPPEHQIFAALNATPLNAVRVCIIGQDPYHAPGQAMGLVRSRVHLSCPYGDVLCCHSVL